MAEIDYAFFVAEVEPLIKKLESYLPEHALATAAIFVAYDCHNGQFRRDGTTPYICHPIAVARSLAQARADVLSISAAILHDVVEDCDVSADQLDDLMRSRLKNFDYNPAELAEVSRLVRKLTKYSDVAYSAYITNVRRSTAATQIKIADILHNLSSDPSKRSTAKYSHALQFLLGYTNTMSTKYDDA